MTPERVEEALKRVVAEGDEVLKTRSSNVVEGAKAAKWYANSLAVLKSVFGGESVHAERLREINLSFDQSNTALLGPMLLAQGVLKGALEAWQNGLIFDVRQLIRADVESDLVGQAQDLLSSGYVRAGAVIAGAVLEEHLRATAPSWGVSVTDSNGKLKTLEPINVDLKKAGAYDGIMQKRVTYLGGIRNEAAHGNPFENRDDDVKRMIADVIDICDRVRTK